MSERRGYWPSLVPEARLFLLGQLAGSTMHLDGAAAEVGVYRGGSAAVLAEAMPGRVLHLFDTFEGLPEPGPNDGAACRAGRFRGTVEEVAQRVPDAIIHVGRVTASPHEPVPSIPWAFVHVDVDQYVSTFDTLMCFYPLMVRGGIMFIDDYGGAPTPGATKAVDAFMQCAPEKLVKPAQGGAWFRRD